MNDHGIVEAGPVRMDTERHAVRWRGVETPDAAQGIRAARTAAAQRGRVLTRWPAHRPRLGSDYFGDTKTLDVHVKRLRSKIEEDPSDPRLLVTVRGLGYRFEG